METAENDDKVPPKFSIVSGDVSDDDMAILKCVTTVDDDS